MKHNICKERSIGKGSSQTLAESREGFGRHGMRRERWRVGDEFRLFIKWKNPTITTGKEHNAHSRSQTKFLTLSTRKMQNPRRKSDQICFRDGKLVVFLKYTSAGRYSGEKQIAAAAVVCIKYKITGSSPTAMKIYPRWKASGTPEVCQRRPV